MSTEVAEKTAFDRLVDIDYSYMHRLWERFPEWSNCIFSDAGKARLANIAGWLLGLAHGGKRDEAEKLADDFVTSLSWLAMAERQVTYETPYGQSVKVPDRKVVLHDDGTLHGFSFATYSAINPEIVDERRAKVREEHPDWHAMEVTAEVIKQLNVTDKYGPDQLTESRWFPNCGYFNVYYYYTYNGGLLYHGPGGGEVFAVTFGDNPRAWSTHT